MADKDTSTLSSYVDSATAAVQSAIGAVTGNTADQAKADEKQAEADAKYEASHATAKLGNMTASSSGAVTVDDPNRQQGSWNQTLGSAKEAVGGLVGSESLKQQGAQQNAEGKAQEAQGQLNDLSAGLIDRAKGALGGAAAGLTGDREAQAAYQDLHDKGKTQQRGVEADLQKQADAAGQ